MKEVLREERPEYRYGTVTGVNYATQRADVLYNGDSDSASVRMSATRPGIGDKVRVTGLARDRYIDAVVLPVAESYQYVETVQFLPAGSYPFVPSDYPWLRALRVTVVGGGGGGGGAALTGSLEGSAGAGGGGGATAIGWHLVSELASSETVTVGGGGAGGLVGGAGNNGTASSFGTLVSANPGLGGGTFKTTAAATNKGGGGGAASTSTGNLFRIPGSHGDPGRVVANGHTPVCEGGRGGESALFGGAALNSSAFSGGATDEVGADCPSFAYGGGGGGAANRSGSNRAGGQGNHGIVILELYA